MSLPVAGLPTLYTAYLTTLSAQRLWVPKAGGQQGGVQSRRVLWGEMLEELIPELYMRTGVQEAGVGWEKGIPGRGIGMANTQRGRKEYGRWRAWKIQQTPVRRWAPLHPLAGTSACSRQQPSAGTESSPEQGQSWEKATAGTGLFGCGFGLSPCWLGLRNTCSRSYPFEVPGIPPTTMSWNIILSLFLKGWVGLSWGDYYLVFY